MSKASDDRTDRITRQILESLAEEQANELASDPPRNIKGSDNTERIFQDLQSKLNETLPPGQ